MNTFTVVLTILILALVLMVAYVIRSWLKATKEVAKYELRGDGFFNVFLKNHAYSEKAIKEPEKDDRKLLAKVLFRLPENKNGIFLVKSGHGGTEIIDYYDLNESPSFRTPFAPLGVNYKIVTLDRENKIATREACPV